MESARLIARRLGVKGGARLRRMGYVAGNLGLTVRFDDDRRWAGEFRLTPTQDSFVILDGIARLWTQMLREHRAVGGRYWQVGHGTTGQATPDAVCGSEAVRLGR